MLLYEILFIFVSRTQQERRLMKRIFFIVSILWVSLLSMQAQPQVLFKNKVQDLGYILWRNPRTIVYEFSNTGDRPLVVSKVIPSCGCTTVDWTKDPIPAGGTGQITAVFDAEAIGHFYKDLSVITNASYHPFYLEFNGVVTASSEDYSQTHPFGFGMVRLDKDEVEFEQVNKGDQPEFVIGVANASDKAYTPVMMHLPQYLKAKAVPEVLEKGKHGKIILTLDTDLLPKLGITRTSVYLSRFSGDKVGRDNEIPISIALLPDFSKLTSQQRNNPPELSLSVGQLEISGLKPGKKKAQTILITNKGKSNLEIYDMQVFGMALSVNLKKTVIKPDEVVKMKVTVIADNLNRSKSHPRILMVTNDPNHSLVTIRVKAKVEAEK